MRKRQRGVGECLSVEKAALHSTTKASPTDDVVMGANKVYMEVFLLYQGTGK